MNKFIHKRSVVALNADQYYPFGMAQASFSSGGDYRYGFNGMERDADINGSQSVYDFGARVYDGRIGRWFSVDPKFKKNSHESPYSFAGNNPIFYIDPDGEDKEVSITTIAEDGSKTQQTIVVENEVEWGVYSFGQNSMGLTAFNLKQDIVLDLRDNGSENLTKVGKPYKYGKPIGRAEGLRQEFSALDYRMKGEGEEQLVGAHFYSKEGQGEPGSTAKHHLGDFDASTTLDLAGIADKVGGGWVPSGDVKDAGGLLQTIIDAANQIQENNEATEREKRQTGETGKCKTCGEPIDSKGRHVEQD